LEADNFVFTGGMYALLSELYAHHDKLEEVWTTIKKLRENEPDFPMDSMKIIKIVALLVKNDRVPGKEYYILNFLFLSLSFVRLSTRL
jgi:hypothetical protein